MMTLSVSLLILKALDEDFQIIYHLLQISFGKLVKTKDDWSLERKAQEVFCRFKISRDSKKWY